MDNKRAVIIVGAGGIGSCLFQDLCRFLPHTVDIHLLDGDTVEGRNVQRQHFSRQDLSRNKAEALAEKATVALGLDRVYFHPQYLTSPTQLERIAKPYLTVILIGAVDNHPARRRMEDFVRRSVGQKRDTYYLDCANELARGEVVAVNVGAGGIQGAFRSEMDPAVLTDDQGDPTTASCSQELDAGNVQVLHTNRKAAIIALELLSAYLQGDVQVGIVYFRNCQTERVVNPGGPPQVAAVK